MSKGVVKGVVDDDMNDNDGNVDDRVTKRVSLSCLPDVFQVSHGEVDSRQAGVGASGGGDPDRAVDVQRCAEQLALLLRLGLCRMLDGWFS